MQFRSRKSCKAVASSKLSILQKEVCDSLMYEVVDAYAYLKDKEGRQVGS